MTGVNSDCRKMEMLKHLGELTFYVRSMLTKIFEGFLQHKKGVLASAEEYGSKADGLINQLTADVLSPAEGTGEEVDRTTVLQFLKSMEQIKYSAVKIGESVNSKIKDGILFSDKAVTELKDVFDVVLDCLKNAGDLAVTGNKVIAGHLISRADLYNRVVMDYATEHEERLIRGICLPKSSIIYLTMMDSLKDILWNIKIIGKAFNK